MLHPLLIFNSTLGNNGAEGECRKLRHLKDLQTERNTNDRHTENKAQNRLTDHKPKAAEHEPEQVSDRMLAKIGIDLLSKRSQHKRSHFECLQTKGDTDNGDAPQ